jgi:hypothetical protein
MSYTPTNERQLYILLYCNTFLWHFPASSASSDSSGFPASSDIAIYHLCHLSRTFHLNNNPAATSPEILHQPLSDHVEIATTTESAEREETLEDLLEQNGFGTAKFDFETILP